MTREYLYAGPRVDNREPTFFCCTDDMHFFGLFSPKGDNSRSKFGVSLVSMCMVKNHHKLRYHNFLFLNIQHKGSHDLMLQLCKVDMFV